MAELKITKSMNFNTLKEIVMASSKSESEKTDLVEFLDKQIALASKKHSSKKETESKQLSQELATVILDILADGKARTVGEIVKEIVATDSEKYANVSSQKVTPILSSLAEVTNTKEKGKSLYSIVE